MFSILIQNFDLSHVANRPTVAGAKQMCLNIKSLNTNSEAYLHPLTQDCKSNSPINATYAIIIIIVSLQIGSI